MPLWRSPLWVIFFLFCKKEKPAERNLILLPWGAFPSFHPTYCSQLFLCIIEDFIWGTVIAALGLAGIQLGMLARVKRRLDLFSIFSLIYLAALGFMAANGFLFFTGITLEASSPYFLCAAVGAVLFLISDLLLCYKLFLNGKAEWAEIGNTIAYFRRPGAFCAHPPLCLGTH